MATWGTTKDYICPRCGGDVPDTEHKGQYLGAISRVDNETEVCSKCGTEEAMLQMAGRLNGKETWWIGRHAESEDDIDERRRTAIEQIAAELESRGEDADDLIQEWADRLGITYAPPTS